MPDLVFFLFSMIIKQKEETSARNSMAHSAERYKAEEIQKIGRMTAEQNAIDSSFYRS